MTADIYYNIHGYPNVEKKTSPFGQSKKDNVTKGGVYIQVIAARVRMDMKTAFAGECVCASSGDDCSMWLG